MTENKLNHAKCLLTCISDCSGFMCKTQGQEEVWKIESTELFQGLPVDSEWVCVFFLIPS